MEIMYLHTGPFWTEGTHQELCTRYALCYILLLMLDIGRFTNSVMATSFAPRKWYDCSTHSETILNNFVKSFIRNNTQGPDNLSKRKHNKTVLWDILYTLGSWWRHQMELFSAICAGNTIFRHLCWEFTGHRWIPRTKASDAELWCFLWSAPKRLNKFWWGRWFETPSCSLWRHCSVMPLFLVENKWCYSICCPHLLVPDI